MPEWLSTGLHLTTRGLEVVGIAAIVLGSFTATITYLSAWLRPSDDTDAFSAYRSSLGKAILLGLEFLVAADIINTVAIEPTLQSVIVLGGIVLIRTFLSFSLEVEIEGRWPWAKHQPAARQTAAPPHSR
jgi:uncharacterized membrane protein